MKSCPLGSPNPSTVEQPSRAQRFRMPFRPRLSLITKRVWGADCAAEACALRVGAARQRHRISAKNTRKARWQEFGFVVWLVLIWFPFDSAWRGFRSDRVYEKVRIFKTYTRNSHGLLFVVTFRPLWRRHPTESKALTLGGLALDSAEGENNFIQLVSADRDAKIACSSTEFEP